MSFVLVVCLCLVHVVAVDDDDFFAVPELFTIEQVRERNASHWQRVYPPLAEAHAALVDRLFSASLQADSEIVGSLPKAGRQQVASDEADVSLDELLNGFAVGAPRRVARRPACPFRCSAAGADSDLQTLIAAAQAHLSAQRFGDAAACLDRALTLAPLTELLWVQLIQLYANAQQATLASDTAAAALTAFPRSAQLLVQYAELHDSQPELWADVLRVDRSQYYAWGRLGQVLEARADLRRAVRCYEEAVALTGAVQQPLVGDVERTVVAYFNTLLTAYLKAPHLYADRAIALCERAVQLFPSFRDFFAGTLARLQRGASASTADGAAQVGELFERGKAYVTQSRLAEALEMFEAASQLAPNVAATHYAVAVVMKALRLDEQASTERMRRAFELEPSSNEFTSSYLHALKSVADWDTLAQYWPRFAAQVERGERTLHPFSCLMFGMSPAVLRRESERMAADVAAQAAGWLAQNPTLRFDTLSRYARLRGCDADGACQSVETPKLRIGYLSSNFINHAQGAQLSVFFAHNDRNVASVHLYSLRRALNAEALEAQALIERAALASGGELTDVSGISEAEVAQRIFDDRIDVLVDLCGLADEARPGVLALRPAPVVVSYLGYPATTGGRFVDYYVGDRHVTDPAHFVEQVAFMPHSYQLTEHERRYDLSKPISLSPQMLGSAAASLYADGDTRVVFCNFNQAIKIDPVVFGVWMSVLKRVNDSVLMLLELPKAAQPHLTRAAAAHGVDKSRLLFMPSIDKLYHTKRLARCDLLLDTTSYTAHTSCGDALWAGTPVLTIPGATMAARVASGMLRAAGLGDAGLIVRDLREYEERAVQLGNDRGALLALKARVARLRTAEPANALFDISQYYRHWMALLRHAWRKQVLELEEPQQFDVAALSEANDVSWGDFSFRAEL
jgi:predicted O-linked N-acetylglucosamine transferase (SPINDLY family)